MKTNKKQLIILLIVIAAAAIAVTAALKGGKPSGKASSESIPVISVSSLSDGTSASQDRYGGILETQKKETIKLDSDKTVKEISVKEGDHVKAGDILFSYDTQSMELEMQQKQIEMEKLDIQISGCNDQISQLKSQLDSGSLSASERLDYTSQMLEAQTNAAQYEYDKKTKASQIAKLEDSIKNASVRTSMNGTVEHLYDLESLSDSNPVFMEIVADGDLRVKGTISEQDIMNIEQDMDVIVRSRSDASKTWKGKISLIETKPVSDENRTDTVYMGMDSDNSSSASKYAFYVDLESTDGLLLGQHVTIEKSSPAGPDADAIYLPDGYVFFENDLPYVWAAKEIGDGLEKRGITLGETDGDSMMYEITSNLSAEEYVAWPDDDCKEGAATVSGN